MSVRIVDSRGNTLSTIATLYRKDFLESLTSSKGTDKDPLMRQRPGTRRKLTDQQISDLYASNGIFANIVDIPAEDCVREWIDFEGIDEKLKRQILNKLANLSAKNIFQEALKYERLRGDGLISIGAKQKGSFKVSESIKNLIDIEYLHPFSTVKLKDLIVNDDVFSRDYGNIMLYEIKDDNSDTKLVDASRIIHIQTRKLEGEKFGIPIIVALYDILMILDNAAWSTGQLMYSMVHKLLKTDIDFTDKELRRKMQAELEYEFNTLSLALLGKDDEFQYIGPKVNLPLAEMYKFIWELLAAVARMPKSHIMGQQQGTITGGQYDSLNYYMRIAGMQESYLREPLEYLVDLLLIAENSGVGEGSIDPDKLEYKLKFNPLWKLDAETDAKVRKMIAETDNIYIMSGVATAGEIRQLRFGDGEALIEKLDMSEEELIKMAKYVKEAFEKNGITEK